MKKMKKLSALALAAIMTASITVPALAADTEITSVTVKIDTNLEEAGMDVYDSEIEIVSITTSAGSDNGVYYDDEPYFTNAPDFVWGEVKPKISFTLLADRDSDYKFDTSALKDGTTLNVIDGAGNAVKFSADESSSKIKFTITLPELEYGDEFLQNLEVEDLEWNDETGVAYWAENEYADSYEVRLYRNGTGVTKIITTTETEYDFSQYFTKAGEYQFKVKGVFDGNKPKEWEESDELDVDKEEAEDIYANWDGTTSTGSSSNNSSSNNTAGPQGSEDGAWLRDNVGWWWCNADRTYPSSTWKEISNKWYYFNAAGYCVQNQWVLTNGLYYYCGPDGDMWVSRWTPDNYWVNADGVWVP